MKRFTIRAAHEVIEIVEVEIDAETEDDAREAFLDREWEADGEPHVLNLVSSEYDVHDVFESGGSEHR